MPPSPGTEAGARIIVPARLTVAPREVAALELHAVVPLLFAALTAAAQQYEEYAARNAAPVAQSCGNLVADSSSTGA